MAGKLRSLGAEVLELPAIRTAPLEDQSRLYTAFEKTWTPISGLPLPVLQVCGFSLKNCERPRQTSVNCTRFRLQPLEMVLQSVGRTWIFPDLIPEVYDGETLGRECVNAALGTNRF